MNLRAFTALIVVIIIVLMVPIKLQSQAQITTSMVRWHLEDCMAEGCFIASKWMVAMKEFFTTSMLGLPVASPQLFP